MINSESKRMSKREINKAARFTISEMLGGRCTPELDDVFDVPNDEDKHFVINEMFKIIERLRKNL